MSASRDPEEVLKSIRALVSREVREAQEKEAAERPSRTSDTVFSEKASQAARLVLNPDDRVAANGVIPPQSSDDLFATDPEPAETVDRTDAPAQDEEPATAPRGALADLDEDALREMIRDVMRDEVRTRMGARINDNIRKIVRQELQAMFPDQTG